MSNKLPEAYQWLSKEPAPKILLEALKLFGTKEIKGLEDNAEIIGWAEEVGGPVADWYKHDDEAWCGLFLSVCAKREGYAPPRGFDAIRALKWQMWGDHVVGAALGDVLVFNRQGGGHVGLYVGEDIEAFHVLGGNQSDQVCITRISKDRLYAIRRTPFKNQPANVRKIFLRPSGGLSQNEA